MIAASQKSRKCRGPEEKKTDRCFPDKTRAREALILSRFIGVYCRGHHHEFPVAERAEDQDRENRNGGNPCAECRDLLDYALSRLDRCPFDPKPKCKACQTHCYKPAYRERIRRVMRYSGIYFVKRGRLDWLIRYFLV